MTIDINVIKKQYVELFQLLVDNQNKKVSTILDDVFELVKKQKSSGGSDVKHLKDDDGNITHIYCYYHKKWEALDQVEFGLKKNSTTGFNTMCKEGTNIWYKQNRLAKQVDSKVLELLTNGDIDPSEVASTKEAMLADVHVIVPRQDQHGWDNVEDIPQ